MRVAVVGTGSIGRRHIQNAEALGHDVIGYDIGCGPIARLADADAWVIATPHDVHLLYAQLAARFRIPFFVEKPLGALGQLPAWRDVVTDSRDLTTQVGYNLRWQRQARALHAAIAPARWVDCSVECDTRTWPGKSYGPFMLEASHEIDLALWCGAHTLVDATVTDSVITIRFENGLVTLRDHAPAYRREWSGASAGRGYQWAFDAPDKLGSEMYLLELAHFLNCVRDGKQTDCPLSEGLRVLEVCQQVEMLAKQAA